MLTWVLYDISNDRTRDKAAKACLRIGLYRVQKSVFLGTLNPNEIDELAVTLEGLIAPATDSVYVFPMCRSDFDKCVLLGQAFDQDLVTDQVRSLFV
jgi:CRISPR-associated protein Cas2